LPCIISLLNPLIIERNNKEERGHPCLDHLEEMKKTVGDPLIRTIKFAKVTHP